MSRERTTPGSARRKGVLFNAESREPIKNELEETAFAGAVANLPECGEDTSREGGRVAHPLAAEEVEDVRQPFAASPLPRVREDGASRLSGVRSPEKLT